MPSWSMSACSAPDAGVRPQMQPSAPPAGSSPVRTGTPVEEPHACGPPGNTHLRRGRRYRRRAQAARLAQPEAGGRLASQPATLRPPRIGSRPVSEVSSADVLAVLTPIWHVRPDTARRVRQRISAVPEWSIAMDHRADDPVTASGRSSGRNATSCATCGRCPIRAVAAAIGTVRASRATRAVKLASSLWS